ncbi:hypothetical protein PHYSODRAFT_324448 [Phytophthora sojae]|uniref:Uncharacterized protein n=1 Tax=Phytophthora sojae (strain P6497) TaxID=1094619 RepID=G4YXF2_PHYSP|nr:hypothetical protein PHYSODRAFT_324448 [Phytophthora sojae]EGZ23221.1 hypothetical protein PHYSODRAFT_324448 [Phytophthora sojae]|eukprot:XP_009518509.1 hypothetical protein PHYSODRAFT_324448 [Phytophthora sojae]
MSVGLGSWGPDSRPVTCDCGRPKGDARLAARDLGCTKQPADEALTRITASTTANSFSICLWCPATSSSHQRLVRWLLRAAKVTRRQTRIALRPAAVAGDGSRVGAPAAKPDGHDRETFLELNGQASDSDMRAGSDPRTHQPADTQKDEQGIPEQERQNFSICLWCPATSSSHQRLVRWLLRAAKVTRRQTRIALRPAAVAGDGSRVGAPAAKPDGHDRETFLELNGQASDSDMRAGSDPRTHQPADTQKDEQGIPEQERQKHGSPHRLPPTASASASGAPATSSSHQRLVRWLLRAAKVTRRQTRIALRPAAVAGDGSRVGAPAAKPDGHDRETFLELNGQASDSDMRAGSDPRTHQPADTQKDEQGIPEQERQKHGSPHRLPPTASASASGAPATSSSHQHLVRWLLRAAKVTRRQTRIALRPAAVAGDGSRVGAPAAKPDGHDRETFLELNGQASDSDMRAGIRTRITASTTANSFSICLWCPATSSSHQRLVRWLLRAAKVTRRQTRIALRPAAVAGDGSRVGAPAAKPDGHDRETFLELNGQASDSDMRAGSDPRTHQPADTQKDEQGIPEQERQNFSICLWCPATSSSHQRLVRWLLRAAKVTRRQTRIALRPAAVAGDGSRVGAPAAKPDGHDRETFLELNGQASDSDMRAGSDPRTHQPADTQKDEQGIPEQERQKHGSPHRLPPTASASASGAPATSSSHQRLVRWLLRAAKVTRRQTRIALRPAAVAGDGSRVGAPAAKPDGHDRETFLELNGQASDSDMRAGSDPRTHQPADTQKDEQGIPEQERQKHGSPHRLPPTASASASGAPATSSSHQRLVRWLLRAAKVTRRQTRIALRPAAVAGDGSRVGAPAAKPDGHDRETFSNSSPTVGDYFFAGLSIEFEKGLSIMSVGLGGWGPDSRPVTCDCGRPKGDARLAARDLGCTKQPADEALVR